MGIFDFKKKIKKQLATENCEFQFYGEGRHLKSDDEMKEIDVVVADAAFKKYKKEILDVYLKAQGFIPYKTANYIRLNSIGLVEYINLQKEYHGSKTFCVNFCLFPLYVQHPFITIGFGNRVGSYIRGFDFWWSYHDMITAENSFTNVVSALDKYIMKWFEQRNTEEVYFDDLIKGKYRIGNSYIEWAIHVFIKNNDIEGGKHFLERIQSDPKYSDMTSNINYNVNKLIEKMRELLESINNTEDYISDAINYNIEKYKFPTTFKKAKDRLR